MTSISYKTILSGYRKGIFPMAKNKTSESLFWVKPESRGIIPIGQLHISKSLKKFIKSNKINTSINKCFPNVVNLCADRSDTWINEQLTDIYQELYETGYACSIEIWMRQKLIGGLFGLTIGSCFCGESMFSLSTNGSKLALIATMAHLNYSGFTLFDTQFSSTHLLSMGGIEILQTEYETLLSSAITNRATFLDLPTSYSWPEMMQLNNQTL